MGFPREPPQTTSTTPEVVTLTASTPTRLTTTRTTSVRGVVITADPANGSPIYVGTTNDLSATAKWMAIVLPAYGPILIPISDASKLYLYTTGTSQKFGWAVV